MNVTEKVQQYQRELAKSHAAIQESANLRKLEMEEANRVTICFCQNRRGKNGKGKQQT